MLVLIGVLILVVGFALKLDSILTIFVSMVVTALVGKLGFEGLVTTLGESFTNNRAMMIFVLVMLVIGTLERNGMKQVAARCIGKIKKASPGRIIVIYGIFRSIFAAFNASFGGVAGFIRPILMPMAEGSIKDELGYVPDGYVEDVKAMSAACENIAWFFFQMLFVGGPGALLVQQTLANEGHKIELIDIAKVEIPVAVFAIIISCIIFLYQDNKLRKKYKNRVEEVKKNV